MGTLLTSPDFWVGAVVLLAYQFAKFSELNAVDPSLAARAGVIPNLRASDFAGRTSFFSAMIVYLAATFAVFLLACSISPAILRGWAVISGTAGAHDELVESAPYPIYIAALYMGLTQPAIPGFSKISNVQRDIFHYWIGVPKRVLGTSDFFTNQILARDGSASGLRAVIGKLTSDAWISKIDLYADTVFYKEQLKRLKLDDQAELAQAAGGSVRELRRTLDQLVYAAAIATVRESGGRALARLSVDLDVAMPKGPPGLRGVAAGAVLAAVGLVFLWFALPMASGLVGPQSSTTFWPRDTTSSGNYLMSQTVPLLIAVGLVLYMRRPADPAALPSGWFDGLAGAFERNLGPLLWAFAVVVVYDYLQLLSQYVAQLDDPPDEPLALLASWAPYHILHAMISVSACFLLLVFMDTRPGARGGRLVPAAAMVVVISAAAAFYALARLRFQYGWPVAEHLDYVVLMVVLNVAAALLGLLAGLAVTRQLAALPKTSPEARTEAAAGPVVVPLANVPSRT